MKFYILILSIFLFFTSGKVFPAIKITSASMEGYSHTQEWLKYLHYKDKNSSIKDDSNFFISANGSIDPLEELKSSLAVFEHPADFLKKGIGHPNCVFPARLSMLSKHFDIKSDAISCPALEKWREDIKSDELKIVLASQFVNNPASVMGHTFFKFQDNKNDYLSLYVGFAADVSENVGAIEYVIKGIGGGFSGIFSTGPYYQKIYEYNSIEERDMWEFSLALNNEERTFIGDHLWELKNTAHFSYYFFSRNCSYILNEIINVAKPDLNLSIDSFYVIPHEAVKKINSNGLVTDIKYIPSSRNKLINRYGALEQKDKMLVLESIRKKSVDEESSIKVLDTLIDYNLLNDQRLRKKNQGVKDINEFTNDVLRKRSLLADESSPSLPSHQQAPLKAHPPRNISFSYLNDFREKNFLNLDFHPGIHRMIDASNGFIEQSNFDFANFTLSYGIDSKKTELSQINLINVSNINTYSSVDPIMSWGFKLFYENERLLLCDRCKNISAQLTYGPTLSLAQDLIFMGFAQISANKNFNEQEKIRWLSPGMNLYLILEKEKYKIILSENIHQDIRKNISNSLILEGELKLRLYEIRRNYNIEVDARHFTSNEGTFTSFELKNIYYW